jgi:hypothetical protein
LQTFFVLGKNAKVASNNLDQSQILPSNISVPTNINTISSSKPSQITAKSEVSQSTAISDRPKAIPKNSRKQQQQKNQSGGVTVN